MNKNKFKDFNPNNMAIPNRIFGLPHNKEEAKIHIIGFPSAITVSGGEGAEFGPMGILDGSLQIELFNKNYPQNAWLPGIFMYPINKKFIRISLRGRKNFQRMINLMGEKNDFDAKKQIKELAKKVDENCNFLHQVQEREVAAALKKNKIVGFIGGCHSSMFAAIKAHASIYKSFTILHFDAHHDLRKAYEGVKYSHASIMYNVLENIPQVKKIVSVGIRSYGEDEYKYAKENKKRIKTFYADDVIGFNYNKVWKLFLKQIVLSISTKEVYISFDIDCFEPYLCPSTGTPVPGGFNMWQTKQLIDVVANKKKIIGFDLSEVVPKTRIDKVVAAEVLYHLCVRALQSQGAYN